MIIAMEVLDNQLVPVLFKLKNFKCPRNVVPAITGDIFELGEWKLDRAIIATNDSDLDSEEDQNEKGNSEEIWEEDEETGEEDKENENDSNDKVEKEYDMVKEEYEHEEKALNDKPKEENNKVKKEKTLKEDKVNEVYDLKGKKDTKPFIKRYKVDVKRCKNVEEEYVVNQVWYCEVGVPIGMEFEWNWALVSKNENKTIFADVERTVKRKDFVGNFKKNISSMWERDSKHQNHIEVEECDVKISLMEKQVTHNQTVCLLGSVPVMGCWIPTRSIYATRHNQVSDRWDVHFKLPLKSRPVYWKWAVINYKTPDIISWESRMNRTLHVQTKFLELRSYWNESGEACVNVARNPPKFVKKSKDNKKVTLIKQVPDPDVKQPSPLYYEMIREIYQIYRALRPDGSYQYRRYKEMAMVESFPKLNTLVDISSNILKYRDAIVFQVTDGGGDKNRFRFALRGSEHTSLIYPDPEELTDISFGCLMKYLTGSRQYHVGAPIIPYENETAKKYAKIAWLKRSFYNEQQNVKIEFVLKPEANYMRIGPVNLPPQQRRVCSKYRLEPKAEGDRWLESIPQSVPKENGAKKKSGDQTKICKGTQTQLINNLSIANIAAAEHRYYKVRQPEPTMVQTTADKQTDTDDLTENFLDNKTGKENGKEKSFFQNIREKLAGLYRNDGEEMVNIGLFQTDVDTGKSEQFDRKDITQKREGLIHMSADDDDDDYNNNGKLEKSNQNHGDEKKHEDIFEGNLDTGKNDGYFSKVKPLVFNIGLLVLRNVFL